MFTIAFREFRSLFTSIRSILIIIVLFGVTVGAARLVRQFEEQLQELGLGQDAYAMGLMLLLILASPLFVTSIAHNVVNKEIADRTIRFLATKTTRNRIIFGKFIGHFLFWSICLTVALLLIVPFSKSFAILDLLQAIIFVSYFIGWTLFLSTSITKPALTMFLGITLSIALPILGLWSTGTDNWFIKIVGYLTPYFYYTQGDDSYYAYLVVIFPIIFILGSLLIFRKRDL
ncbi:ABC transporter permease [Gracilibacillus alcaliphilus]|uniref:ABC transporter permease n=1 Tax=Gracilibacillus alcaliphilus TaxID=1401441 RepID=UPI0019569B0D|nr:ABC transporter permease subunit [Gracilibacillus alcaliphilus]MBM7679437.1 ABC-2 type transport system permease protein [Gracilibacillus alcaliphilus]